VRIDEASWDAISVPEELPSFRHTITRAELSRHLRLTSPRADWEERAATAAFAPHLILVNDWFRVFRGRYDDGYCLPVSATYEFIDAVPIEVELEASGRICEKYRKGDRRFLVFDTLISRAADGTPVMRSIDTAVLWDTGE
jgi:hypothetical protein